MKGTITQALADSLKPKARDFFVWDRALSGFGLKVTPSGKRIYVYQYRLGGRSVPTKRITLGSDNGGWTVAQARARAGELATVVEAGKDPRRQPPVISRAPLRTHSGALETWQIRLGFLCSDIARMQNALLRRTMKQLGATHTQWHMLGQLAMHPGVTQMELAKILGLSKVAVTGLVNRVVRAGWVERRLDDNDKRVRRLFLTRQAKQVAADMRARVDAMVAQSMGHIADEKGEEITCIFETIRDRLAHITPEGWHEE